MRGSDFPYLGVDIGGGVGEPLMSGATPVTYAGLESKEAWKEQTKEAAIDALVHMPLWGGGTVGGYYAPIFDGLNALAYHARGKKDMRNLALLGAVLPTIMPKKVPGANKISNFMNNYIIPKHGDDILRDFVRGESTAGKISGNLGQGIYRPLIGKLVSNTTAPFGYTGLFGKVKGALKSDRTVDPLRYGGSYDYASSWKNVPKNLWTALVKDEPIYSAKGISLAKQHPFMGQHNFQIIKHHSKNPYTQGVHTDAVTAARWYLHREMYDLPLKDYKWYNSISKKYETIPFDEIFKKVGPDDLVRKDDIAFSSKGKLWQFNTETQTGKRLYDNWAKNLDKRRDHVMGGFGTESSKNVTATVLPPPGTRQAYLPESMPVVPVKDRMFDIWDFALNRGESPFKMGKDYISVPSSTSLLRWAGSKLDLWNPVKSIQPLKRDYYPGTYNKDMVKINKAERKPLELVDKEGKPVMFEPSRPEVDMFYRENVSLMDSEFPFLTAKDFGMSRNSSGDLVRNYKPQSPADPTWRRLVTDYKEEKRHYDSAMDMNYKHLIRRLKRENETAKGFWEGYFDFLKDRSRMKKLNKQAAAHSKKRQEFLDAQKGNVKPSAAEILSLDLPFNPKYGPGGSREGQWIKDFERIFNIPPKK